MGFFTSKPDDAFLREQAIKEEQKRKRVELQKSLRHQNWASSQALIEFKIWSTKSQKKFEEVLQQFLRPQFLKKWSWKKWWIIKIPIYVMMPLVVLVFGLALQILFFSLVFVPVAIVKLTLTNFRYWRTFLKELAKFDQKVRDENMARVNAKKQEEIEKQLMLQRLKAREEERLAKQLVVFWRREFEDSSDETLLEAWAVLQQFPIDHYVYFMIENSPGPILRSIVDQEVASRSISVEARQLALHRLERKTADASHYRHLDQLADRAERDAQERHSEVMDGLMSVAMRQLFK